MATTTLGRCDYCERHSVSIRMGWVVSSSTHNLTEAAIRQICTDLDACRANGGNPLEPKLVHDFEDDVQKRGQNGAIYASKIFG